MDNPWIAFSPIIVGFLCMIFCFGMGLGRSQGANQSLKGKDAELWWKHKVIDAEARLSKRELEGKTGDDWILEYPSRRLAHVGSFPQAEMVHRMGKVSSRSPSDISIWLDTYDG